MPLTLEAEFSPGMALAESREIARLVERAGFDRLGVSDVVLWPDTFVVQALCAEATERIEIGTMVSNPYTRHPAVLAAATADLAEISGGRAFVGLGVGAGLDAIGVPSPRPAAAVREAVTMLRFLLDGATVPADGTVFRAAGARLRRPPAGRVPIAVGTRSRSVMGIAGELADRALVGARYLSDATAETYRGWISAGAARGGRRPEEVEVAPRLTLCVSDDAEAAYRTMRRDTAEFLVTLRPSDLDLAPGRFDAISKALADARGWYFDTDAYHPPELERLVDDDLVRRFAICGTPREALEQLRRIAAMGFSSLSMKLAPVRRPGVSMFEGLSETITAFSSVVPDVRRLGA